MTQLPVFALRSHVEELVWPAIQSGRAAEIMSLQRQFDQSQFWSPEQIKSAQFSQLAKLVEHSLRTVPAYAARLRSAGITAGKPLTEALWQRIPVLTRSELRTLGAALHSSAAPASFGALSVASSGGSSGLPVTVRKSAVEELFWQAINIRDEVWNRENLQGTIARLRDVRVGLPPHISAASRTSHGALIDDWGSPSNLIWKTGKMGIISPDLPLETQAKFLTKLKPDYLYTFPSCLRPLLSHFQVSGRRLTSLKSVWTVSESVDESLRQACFDVFGCKIIQNYTCGEIGYLALQCPTCTNLHVQSEVVYLEILDAENRPCAPGEIGRVVVTPLHNYAMPLLRYELGDEAEAGGPCGCGRGLPVMTRVVGRTEDYLTLPSGRRRRVNINHYRLSSISAVREFQLVQNSLNEVELKLALSRPLTPDELTVINTILDRETEGLFETRLTYHDALPRTSTGKLRAFISHLT